MVGVPKTQKIIIGNSFEDYDYDYNYGYDSYSLMAA
jgi:hypothetical protein